MPSSTVNLTHVGRIADRVVIRHEDFGAPIVFLYALDRGKLLSGGFDLIKLLELIDGTRRTQEICDEAMIWLASNFDPETLATAQMKVHYWLGRLLDEGFVLTETSGATIKHSKS